MGGVLRAADCVPQCLLDDGVAIDAEECLAFFAARRAVLLGDCPKDEAPLTPLPQGVLDRWQGYLRDREDEAVEQRRERVRQWAKWREKP